MNAKRLLALYERVADAPDAILRLRRFVLDFAVRGKLVVQDPGDEPASESLKRIGAAREAAPQSGRSGNKNRADPSLAELPFVLPDSWLVTRLADLVRVVNGRAYKQSELLNEGTPVLRVGNLFTSQHWYYSNLELEDDKYCERGDLIYAWSASFGPFIWDGLRVIYHYHIWKLPLFSEADLDKQFLYLFLQQKTREIKDAGHGMSMVHMTKEKMEQLAVPLPPLAEQRRIVAKVEELMALLDRLEAARTAREAIRDRLTAASLARLTASDTDAETFPTRAGFALDALPALTSRADQIKALRQTILNLAMRGKLVEQDPNDEPASELLKRISDAREAAVTAGRIKKSRKSPTLDNDDAAASLPKGWAIAPLVDVYDIRDGTHDTPKYFDNGVPLVTSKNLSSGKLSLDDTKLISMADHLMISERSRVDREDILFAMIGSIGNPVIVDTNVAFSIKNVALFKYFIREWACPSFLKYFLMHAAEEMRARAAGGLQPFVSLGFLRSFPIRLPPLAEQHRIVAKVDALMALCDQLETALATADTTRARLLEALLHETLSPATTRDMKAA